MKNIGRHLSLREKVLRPGVEEHLEVPSSPESPSSLNRLAARQPGSSLVLLNSCNGRLRDIGQSRGPGVFWKLEEAPKKYCGLLHF